MTVSSEIFKRLLKDRELRMKVGLALGISDQGVYASAKRTSDVFTKKVALIAISEHTGLTEEEILETVKA